MIKGTEVLPSLVARISATNVLIQSMIHCWSGEERPREPLGTKLSDPSAESRDPKDVHDWTLLMHDLRYAYGLLSFQRHVNHRVPAWASSPAILGEGFCSLAVLRMPLQPG